MAPDPLWDLLGLLRGERRAPVRSLWDAVKDRDVALARAFIDEGHDVNTRFVGGDALGTAAANADLEMVRMLLDAGAAPAGDVLGGPLQNAVTADEDDAGERRAVIEALVAAGPDAADLAGALAMAAHLGDGPAAALIVAGAGAHGAGAGLDAGRAAAASKAEAQGHQQLARYLRGEDHDPGPRANPLGALSELLGGVDIEGPAALERFLGLDELDDEAMAPPRRATGAEHESVERELCARIRAGTVGDALGRPGLDDLTPAAFAASHGLAAVLEALLDAGVQASGGRDGSLLAAAAEAGHLACVELLLAAGAKPDETGDAVYTPLMRAAENGHVDVVRALLVAGANPRHRTEAGESAMQRVGGLEVAAIRALLRAHAADFPSATDRGLASAGKVRPASPQDGIAPFLEHTSGHPEWVFIAARAPLEAVSTALAEIWGARERLADVARRAVPEGPGVFALQLDGHPWSLAPIRIGDYRLEDAALADAAAPALATRLGTTALACYGEDTSASIGACAFRNAEQVAAVEWPDGETLHYEGEGEGPEGRTPEARLRRFFRDLELFVPALEIASDGFDQQLVIRNVGLRAVAQVDFLAL